VQEKEEAEYADLMKAAAEEAARAKEAAKEKLLLACGGGGGAGRVHGSDASLTEVRRYA
jgi:hypothetical protein